MIPNWLQPMGAATGRQQASLGRHQILMKEGIPVCQTYAVGAPSRIQNEGTGRHGGRRTLQPVGCTICTVPHSVTGQHCNPPHNKRRTTTSYHDTAGTVTERNQSSTGNAYAPRPTAHDESYANATNQGHGKGGQNRGRNSARGQNNTG